MLGQKFYFHFCWSSLYNSPWILEKYLEIISTYNSYLKCYMHDNISLSETSTTWANIFIQKFSINDLTKNYFSNNRYYVWSIVPAFPQQLHYIIIAYIVLGINVLNRKPPEPCQPKRSYDVIYEVPWHSHFCSMREICFQFKLQWESYSCRWTRLNSPSW